MLLEADPAEVIHHDKGIDAGRNGQAGPMPSAKNKVLGADDVGNAAQATRPGPSF